MTLCLNEQASSGDHIEQAQKGELRLCYVFEVGMPEEIELVGDMVVVGLVEK